MNGNTYKINSLLFALNVRCVGVIKQKVCNVPLLLKMRKALLRASVWVTQ